MDGRGVVTRQAAQGKQRGATRRESGAETRRRLLEAAEELFSQEGFERVSVRDITERASANVAAINYHFGSREGLVGQVMARYINPINEERLRLLDEIEARHGDSPPPLEEVMDAFVRPFATQVSRSELSERLFFKLMARVCGDQLAELPAEVERGFETMLARFRAAFRRCLPEVPEEELTWRIHFAVGAMLHSMAHWEMLNRFSQGAAGSPTTETILNRLIQFAVAGMNQGR